MANVIDITTEDNLQYTFYPVSSGGVSLRVRAPNDAHIALTTGPMESDPMYEIIIGGWANSKSVIRRNRQKPDKIEVELPDLLNAGEFRAFWIRWDCGIISAGRDGEPVPFISWQDPEPFPIGFIGVCTGWGATGTWKIEVPTPGSGYPSAGGYPAPGGYPGSGYPSAPSAPLMMAPSGGGGGAVWVDAASGQMPPGAVVGGQDGEALYVARARHEGALIPGKLAPSHGVAYVAWGGAEHGKQQYQVLCGGNPNWVPVNGSNIPPGAFPGGESEDGEPLFVGRVRHEGSVTVGKVQPSHGVCYIPYGGQELGFPDYEVLVMY